MTDEDRTVHAEAPGLEVVRYNTSGLWYLEPTDDVNARSRVLIKSAVKYAVWAVEYYGEGQAQIFYGRPGGTRFDALVRRALAS